MPLPGQLWNQSKAAAALEGLTFFEPFASFDADTVSATMAWLLIHDVLSPVPELAHPFEVLTTQSFHGGMQRCPYKQESIGTSAFIVGKLGYTMEL